MPSTAGSFSGDDAQVFRMVAGATALLVTVLMLLIAIAQPDTVWRAVRNIVVVDATVLVTLWLAGRGHFRTASWIFLAVLVALITYNAPPFGGIRSPGVQAYFIFVMLAGLLLGERAGVAVAVACALLALGLVVAERGGFTPVPASDYNSTVRWLLICLYMSVALLTMRVATGRIRRALADARHELAERRQAEAERKRVVVHLGERIKELRLVHEASRLIQHASGADRLLLAELAARMPAAWLYGEDACARITFDGIVVSSSDWPATPWVQTATFTTQAGDGLLEVAYRSQHPAADEGPFLAEERALLDSLAEILRAHIERHVTERRRKSAEAQLRQAQKMDALGTLAGGIAHDFNHLLTVIGVNTQLAELDAPPGGPVAERLKEIQTAHGRARDLVRQILLFGRRHEASPRIIALAPLVEEALQLLRSTVPRSVEIQTRVADGLPRVRADASQMHQLIMNLGTNAAYAMRERGGVLSVDLERVDVPDGAASISPELSPGPYLRITVADTGAGMTEEVQDRLFEPFFTTKGQAGTGLGLSVVDGIVRDHGGSIDVTSEIGTGTRFVIHLPAEEDATEPAPPALGGIARGTGQHVMYVDDEAELGHVMARALRRLGYRCTGFTDPTVAVHEFRTAPHDFDVVISDLQMAGMSGLELARAVRAIRADTPVAIISGYPAEEIVTDPDVRSVMWLSKPVPLEELATRLHQLLRGGSSAQ